MVLGGHTEVSCGLLRRDFIHRGQDPDAQAGQTLRSLEYKSNTSQSKQIGQLLTYKSISIVVLKAGIGSDWSFKRSHLGFMGIKILN